MSAMVSFSSAIALSVVSESPKTCVFAACNVPVFLRSRHRVFGLADRHRTRSSSKRSRKRVRSHEHRLAFGEMRHRPRGCPVGLALHPRLSVSALIGTSGASKADFERECQKRGIDLFELPPRSPELNGHVERNNGAWRYEFYATWDLPNDDLDDVNRWIDAFADEFDTFRPHHALDQQTPAEYLHSLTAKETPYRLICREPGQ